MSEQEAYLDNVAIVRESLGAQLAANPDDAGQFGHGTVVCAMDYGDRGEKGDMVWYVSRKR